jgi:hypothetical protein
MKVRLQKGWAQGGIGTKRGMMFHVLNRANAGAGIFGKEADYAAF